MKKTNWNSAKWRNSCAWCATRIQTDQEVFGISIALRKEAFRELESGMMEPMLLHKAGKTVPMLIVAEDSPAKLDGKDAVFQTCSEACAKSLQQALRDELAG